MHSRIAAQGYRQGRGYTTDSSLSFLLILEGLDSNLDCTDRDGTDMAYPAVSLCVVG